MRILIMMLATAGVLGLGLSTLQADEQAEENGAKDLADEAPHDGLAAGRMNNERLAALLAHLDPELSGRAGFWTLTLGGTSARVITDETADRMRIIIPVAEVDGLQADEFYRLLQANYESALDARYAIAQGVVWSVFIHPLSPLSEAELLSAIAQTFNAAATYGTTYTSGAFSFGGGDNSEVHDAITEKGIRS